MRISYDNSKIAVAKITGSRGRTPTQEFLRLPSHYLFEAHFCLVRRANEKGHVENLLGFARRNYLVPVPRVNSLAELNEELQRRCQADLERTLQGKSASKRQLLLEEHAVMRELPSQAFAARRVTQAAANSLSLVQFDTNRYSVPVKYAHRQITVVASVDEVRLVFDGQLVARHPRHWGREQYLFDPIHYLALLESLIVTTNLPFESWTEVLGSERLTGAALDRLTHRCHILETTGESYRLKDAQKRCRKKSQE